MANDREWREIESSLSREIDEWLRGNASRRSVLKTLLATGGAAALSGSLAGMTSALAQGGSKDFAPPDSPLGQAQIAALKASTEGPKDGSAYRAVEAAKKFKNITLNVTYESQLQALEPRNFSG